MKTIFKWIIAISAMPLPLNLASANEFHQNLASSDHVVINREPPLPPQPRPPMPPPRERPPMPPPRERPPMPPPRERPPMPPPRERPPMPPPRQPPPPHRPPPWRPPPPAPPPRQPIEEARTVYLNQYFSETTLDLDRMFDLRRFYWDYAIDRFEVRVSNGDQFDQELTLLVNGYIEDRIRPGYFSPLYVHGYKSIGRDIDSVELYVNGTVLIDSITVYLRRY